METTRESIQKFKVSHEKEWHRTKSTILDTLVHTPKIAKVLLVKRVSRLANVSLAFSTLVIRDLIDSKDLLIIDESYISMRS
jgi:hypothetical protein